MPSKKRVALLVGAPAPWDPGFERLARLPNYEFRVFYCRERQPGMAWTMQTPGYPAEFLNNWGKPTWSARLRDMNPGVWRAFSRFRPDAVVVHGYSTVTDLVAIAWAKTHRVPLLLRGDSNILDEAGLKGARRAAKRAFLRLVAGGAGACLSVGTLNREYWEDYGVPPERIFLAPFAVDTEYFRERTAALDRDDIKEERGWPEPYLALYVGRLVGRKRVDVAIDALRALGGWRRDIGLLVAGDGVERERLVERARGLDHVHFVGFADRDELPTLYAASDVLVVPSESEPWGLVVGEAMSAGLPAIVTRKVGAGRDLVADGKSGYVIPENDVGALAGALDKALKSREHVRALGDEALRTMASWGVDAYVAGYERALAFCLGG